MDGNIKLGSVDSFFEEDQESVMKIKIYVPDSPFGQPPDLPPSRTYGLCHHKESLNDYFNCDYSHKDRQESLSDFIQKDQSENRGDDIFYEDESIKEEIPMTCPSLEGGEASTPQNQIPQEERVQELDSSRQRKRRTASSKSSNPKEFDTRNFFQFVWKVFKRFFKDVRNNSQDFEVIKAWEMLSEEKPSRFALTELFQRKELRKWLKTFFKTRFIFREIIDSGISPISKRCYIKYTDTLRKGFVSGRLDLLKK